MIFDFLNCFVFVYLDNILILYFFFSKDITEHVSHVRQVLQQLLENRLYVKAEKCEFQFCELLGLHHWAGAVAGRSRQWLGGQFQVPANGYNNFWDSLTSTEGLSGTTVRSQPP